MVVSTNVYRQRRTQKAKRPSRVCPASDERWCLHGLTKQIGEAGGEFTASDGVGEIFHARA